MDLFKEVCDDQLVDDKEVPSSEEARGFLSWIGLQRSQSGNIKERFLHIMVGGNLNAFRR